MFSHTALPFTDKSQLNSRANKPPDKPDLARAAVTADIFLGKIPSLKGWSSIRSFRSIRLPRQVVESLSLEVFKKNT